MILPPLSILAIVQTPSTADAIQAAVASPGARSVRLECDRSTRLDPSIVAERLRHSRYAALLIEMPAHTALDTFLSDLAIIAVAADRRLRVIVIGHQNDVSLARRLRGEGITEYLTSSAVADELLEVLAQHLGGTASEQHGQLIAVIGARGGAGATTTATNIAWHLRHASVCLVDLAQPLGGLAYGLGLNNQVPPEAALLCTPEQIDADTVDAMLMHKDGIAVLSAPPDLERHHNPLTDPAALLHLVALLRARFGHVVLDLPLSWNPSTEALLTQATGVVLVTTPDFAGIPPAQRLLAHFAALSITPTLVLMHARNGAHSGWTEAATLDALAAPTAFTIAEAPEIREALARGEPVSAIAPTHPATLAFASLTAALAPDAPASGAARQSLPRRLRAMMRRALSNFG
ncbi:cellulose synthase operon protein YhjQ/BcsQ [Xanthobacter sp. V13C-7B]|uniref:AAA family ATPase n=1 Tax=Xanthobacter variabilis TaxID=3119932 RepID=UPI00372BBAE0